MKNSQKKIHQLALDGTTTCKWTNHFQAVILKVWDWRGQKRGSPSSLYEHFIPHNISTVLLFHVHFSILFFEYGSGIYFFYCSNSMSVRGEMLARKTSLTQPLFVACTKQGKWAVMYWCVRGIDFTSLYDFVIGVWNCTSSVVFCLHFIPGI